MEGTFILVIGIAGFFVGAYFIKAYLFQRHLVQTQQGTIALMGERMERTQISFERFRKLHKYMQTVREEERIRVVREIHDEVGQLLTVVKIDISRLNNNLKNQTRGGSESLAILSAMNDKIGTTINSIRKIVGELRPVVLDHLGLMEAIEWSVQKFRDRTGFDCSIRTKIRKIKIEQSYSVVIFRAFEGILSVVSRRTGVSRLIVTVRNSDNVLAVHVEDDGIGLYNAAEKEEIDLILMESEERIKSIGGTLNFKRHTGINMEVTIAIYTI